MYIMSYIKNTFRKEDILMLKKLQEKAGFVSLETLVVTGVVLAVAVYALTQYNDAARLATDAAEGRMTAALELINEIDN